jgi:RNA polymerase sigma-70 factor (ECF subfamily)
MAFHHGHRQRPSRMPPSNLIETRDADRQLVARCLRNDPGAFDDLYARYAPRVYSLACRITGSPTTGEDLVQDIFLLVYRKLASFKGESALGTWVYRLAANCCVDHLRSRHHRLDQASDALDDEVPPPGAVGRFNPARLDLDRAIEQLPPGYRAAFVLHDVEGYDHREIAGMLGIAEGTSKSQVHKARMRMRALLSTEG